MNRNKNKGNFLNYQADVNKYSQLTNHEYFSWITNYCGNSNIE